MTLLPDFCDVYPQKLNMESENESFSKKEISFFSGLFFRFHVSFRVSKQNGYPLQGGKYIDFTDISNFSAWLQVRTSTQKIIPHIDEELLFFSKS